MFGKATLGVCALFASTWPALAGCGANDTICQNAVRDQKTYQAQQEADQQKRYNRDYGTSQYTGPTLTYDPKTGSPGVGYKWSTK